MFSCTTSCDIQNSFFFLSTWCVWMFHISMGIKCDISLNNINQLVFLKDTEFSVK